MNMAIAYEIRYNSKPCVVLQRCEQVLCFASLWHASVRMTVLRFVVILTEGKDLYEMCINNILSITPYLGLLTMNLQL